MKKSITLIFVFLLSLSYVSAYYYNCEWTFQSFYGADYGWAKMWDYNVTTKDCLWDTAETRLIGYSFIDMGAGSSAYISTPPNYSNGTLWSVAKGRDFSAVNDGYFYMVLPRSSMPHAPGNIYASTSHSWDAGIYGVTGRDNRTQISLNVGGPRRRTAYNGINIPPPPINDEKITPTYGLAIYWDACDFECATWGSCGVTDTQSCASVTDGNGTGTCPVDYFGNTPSAIPDVIFYENTVSLSEFGTQACDYCTPDWACTTYTECGEDDYKNCTAVIDNNDCFATTGLPADEYTGNYSEFREFCGAAPKSGGGGGSALIVSTNIKNLQKEKEASSTPLLCKDNPAIGVVCDRFEEQPGLFLLLGIIVIGVIFGKKR